MLYTVYNLHIITWAVIIVINYQISPYLPRQRNMPTENAQALGVELDKTYIEIAQRVNERVIGIYSTNTYTVTGETWYLTGQSNKQQSVRQVYQITSLTSFNHGINFVNVSTFTKITGIGFDGTNYYPLPYVDGATTTGSVGLKVSPTQVVISVGVTPPGFVSGIIILEWLSNITTNS